MKNDTAKHLERLTRKINAAFDEPGADVPAAEVFEHLEEQSRADQAAHDAAVERWLREEVAPTYDRVMADSEGETVSAEEARAMLRAHMVKARERS